MRGNAHIRKAATERTATQAGVGATSHASIERRLNDLAHERSSASGGYAAAVAWAFGGFVIGAVLWQVVGVWSVLSDVVREDAELPRITTVARAAPVPLLPNCTTLALNRMTGETRSIPCPQWLPLIEEASAARVKLAIAGRTPLQN